MASISAKTFNLRPKPRWSTWFEKIWVCNSRHSRHSIDALAVDDKGQLYAFRHHHQQVGAPEGTALRRRLPTKVALAMYHSLINQGKLP